jgi:predicted nuclease of predicted toxin-antitoxin system
MVMTDEHLANAIARQLTQKDVNAVRLIDHLVAGTPDPEVLEYCHQHGYALITLDEPMRGHIHTRTRQGLEHAGVFIGTKDMQGQKGVGIIINFIVFFNESIEAGAATVEDDVYNQIIPIS